MANRIARTTTHAAGREDAEPRLPAGERSRDFAPLAEDVEQRAGEPGQRQAVVPLLPFRPVNRMATAAKTSATPSHPRSPRTRFNIDRYPRHRSLSTDLAVRNSPNVMKLR